jgi:hypothetical protein
VALTKRGKWRYADSAADLDDYLLRHVLGQLRRGRGREHQVVHARCSGCGGGRFDLFTDESGGRATQALRVCTSCRAEHFICDPEGRGNPAAVGEIVCVCCCSEVEVAAGFSVEKVRGDDPKTGEVLVPAVRYLWVAGRCTHCGCVGVYAEWSVRRLHRPAEMAALV